MSRRSPRPRGRPRDAIRSVLRLRVTQALLALTLSTAAGLLSGELLVRWVHGERLGLFPRYVTDTRYAEFRIRGNVPGARYAHTSSDGRWEFRINSRGFRDTREFSYAKPPGRLRVLALGDSFTIGYEVEQHETYAAVIERYLNKHGVDAEVINAGMSGNSNAEELVFLEHEGIRYDPDVVVLGFFENDLDDNVRTGLYHWRDGRLVLRSSEYLPAIGIRNFLNAFAPYRWSSEHSYLHNYLGNAATLLAKRRLAGHELERAAPASSAPAAAASYKEGLAVALVRRMAEVAHEHEACFVILDIPARDLRASFPAHVSDPVGLADHYVSGADLLREYSGLAELYRPHGQRHWTATAHLVAGIEVGRRLRERCLGPAHPGPAGLQARLTRAGDGPEGRP